MKTQLSSLIIAAASALALLSLLLCTPSLRAADDGLIARWHADGNPSDSSGHDNYAEYLGTARYAPGLAGEAFDFDGEESYVATTLRISPDDVPETTWSVWARPRRNDSRRLLLEADDAGFDRFITIENGFWGVGTGRGIWCPVPAKLDAWQHLAVVFARDSIRFYVNGQEYICPDAPGGQESQTKLRIGGSPFWKQFFDGLADEVEIYDRALGADEIKAIYEKLRPAAESSPVESAGSSHVENNAAAERTADQPPAAPVPAVPLAVAAPPPKPLPLASASPPSAPAATPKPPPESPAVAAAIAAQDPDALARALLKERWDNNLMTDSSRPLKPLHNKMGAARGKTALVVFYADDATAGFETCKTKEGLRQRPKGVELKIPPATEKTEEAKIPLKTAILASERPEAKSGKLSVIVITPNFPQTIQEEIRNLGGDPKKITIVQNADDSIRHEMGLYSTHHMLFDPKGQMVWSLRAGQRGDGNTGTADLDEAITRVVNGKYKAQTSLVAAKAGKTPETPVFTFEDGADGWSFSGTWKEGTSSEADYPGLVKGFEGRRWLSSFPPNGSRTGIAVSPTFKIEKRYLHLKAGGGDLIHQTGVALVCGGTTPQISTGKNTFEMNTVTWDLVGLQGKDARIVAYDADTTEMRNGIMLDAVFASDSPAPPASFADHHDPNNQAHAARVAADIPEDYRAFQTGDFHCEAKEGRTFVLENKCTFPMPNGPVRVPAGVFTDTASQTIVDQGAEISWGKNLVKGVLVGTEKETINPGNILVEYKGRAKAGETCHYRNYATIKTRNLVYARGRPETPPSLPEKERTKIWNTYPESRSKEFTDVMGKEGLKKWPQETDIAYVMRLTRWVQRYWTDWAFWGGFPAREVKAPNLSEGGRAGLVEMQRKSLSCPAVCLIRVCLTASDVPTMDGQGMWLDENPERAIPGHVRVYVFIESSGWILIDDDKGGFGSPGGSFTFGRGTSDRYAIHIWDENSTKMWHTRTVDIDLTWKSRLAEDTPP